MEDTAQEWSDNCVYEHSSKQQKDNAGQNIYYTTDTKVAFGNLVYFFIYIKKAFFLASALKAASDMWWDEYKMYPNPQNLILTQSVFNTGVGHFTQVNF